MAIEVVDGVDNGAQQQDDDQSSQNQQHEGETLDGAQGQGGEGGDQGDDEGVVITIGNENPPSDEDEQHNAAPQWVKDLRKADREKSKRIRELEQEKVERERAQQPGAVKLGDKPTLAGCDFDEDRFETELTGWHEKKRATDDLASKQRKEQEDAQAAWQGKLSSYDAAKAALKVDDFEDAEAVVLEQFSQTQQAIIINGADKPEQVVYALGKNPAKAKELAAIKDPVKYAFAIAKLETQLKVTPRKAPPAPERVVRGTAAASTSDTQLAKLEAEADRTGDRTKVAQYRRQKMQDQRQAS